MVTNRYRYSNYEYETSPRKLKPIEEPKRHINKPKQKKLSKKEQERIASEEAKKRAQETKKKIKAVCYLVLGFAIVFALSYRNSQINEAFTQKQKLEKQISQVKKENEQLQVSIQNSLNLSQIEQLAKEKLGMQKLTSRQTVYIDLPKKDYVEAGTEEVVIEENNDITSRIINFIKNIFK